jgi:hypothetical protein
MLTTMRWIALSGAAMLSLGSAAWALDGQNPREPARSAPVRVETKAPPLRSTSTKPVPGNAESRRADDERQRKWDERMKRVTRSMCSGC